jgi:hypothetical protein
VKHTAPNDTRISFTASFYTEESAIYNTAFTRGHSTTGIFSPKIQTNANTTKQQTTSNTRAAIPIEQPSLLITAFSGIIHESLHTALKYSVYLTLMIPT